MPSEKRLIPMAVVTVVLIVAAAAVGAGQHAATRSREPYVVTPPSSVVSLEVIPEGKKGPEGQLHDEYTVTEFHVVVGRPVTLRIDNTDTVPHSITAPEAGVNIVVMPGTHSYKLLVNKPGDFEWHCTFECDPWSMQHLGYMRGFITATPA